MKNHAPRYDRGKNLCLVHVVSGMLILENCDLAIKNKNFKSVESKVACVHQMPGTTTYINNCHFRGGGKTQFPTLGLYASKANCLVANS